MKKKYVTIGIVSILLLITGVGYSVTYKTDPSHAELITNLSDGPNTLERIEDTATIGEDTISKNDIKQASDREAIGENPKIYSEDALVNTTDHHIIYIHMCGEVVEPGVYEVSEGARVIDLIQLAGGLSKEAAGDYINQALMVSDGQRIYIPSKEEIKELPVTTDILSGEGNRQEQSTTEKQININLADAEELMELPGVGEAKAASIIEYRNTNGSFQTIEELMKIPGIKEGLFHKVSPHITVR